METRNNKKISFHAQTVSEAAIKYTACNTTTETVIAAYGSTVMHIFCILHFVASHVSVLELCSFFPPTSSWRQMIEYHQHKATHNDDATLVAERSNYLVQHGRSGIEGKNCDSDKQREEETAKSRVSKPFALWTTTR